METNQLYRYRNLSRQYKCKKLRIHYSKQLCLQNTRKNDKCLIDIVSRNKQINNWYKSGFRSQSSPIDHVIRLEAFIIKKEHLVAVFSILKRHDTTWMYNVVKDVKNLGLEGRMPVFIQNFLQDRKFRVRMGEVFSKEKEQEMGVPQGSLLSVMLFNIKINNIV